MCGRIGGYHRCSLEDGYPFLYVSLKFQEIFGWSKEEIETRFDNKLMNIGTMSRKRTHKIDKF